MPRPISLPAVAALAVAAAVAFAGAAEPSVVAEPMGLDPARVDRVRLRAQSAPRDEVLAALAHAARFEIVPGDGRPAPRALTLDLADAAVEDALAEVLAGVPYHLHYEPGEGGVSLRRVTVGLLPPRAGAARSSRPAARDARPVAFATRSGERAEARPDYAERRARLEKLRGARSDADRAEAASLMRPDEDLAGLLAYLRDPSAEVRARAAESLGDVELGEDAFRTRDALLEALGDPEPAVVAAAVEALSSLHEVLPDPRIRAGVARVARHPAAAVRDAVAEFRAWADTEEP